MNTVEPNKISEKQGYYSFLNRSINLPDLAYLSLILVIITIGIVFSLEIISVGLIGIITICFSYNLNRKKSLFLIKIAVAFLLFQNTFVGIIANISGNSAENLSYTLQASVLIIYIAGFIALLKKRLDKIDCIAFVMIGLLIISTFLTDAPIVGKINYFRNYTYFYFLFILSRFALSGEKEYIKFAKFVTVIGIISVLFILVTFSLPDSFWSTLGIEKIYIAKGSPLEKGYYDSTEGRFRSDIFGLSVIRRGSFMFEPINYGYFILAAWLISLTYTKGQLVKSLVLNKWTPIFFIGLILSFGKGAWLFGGVIFMIALFHQTLMKELIVKKISLFRTILISASIFVVVFSIWYNTIFGGATNTHFIAIRETFANVIKRPLGYGLGTGGNFGGGDGYDWLASGGETGLMAMAYQMGVHFLLLFVVICYWIGKRMLAAGNSFVNTIFSYSIFISVIMFLFQENTFAPQCITLFVIPCGLTIKNEKVGYEYEDLFSWI